MPIKSSSPSSTFDKPPISLAWRLVISVLLLIHLLAVFMPPFTFATSSGPGMGSPLAEPVLAALRPYIDFFFLDHGYFFFAPNPGPSHLLRTRLEFSDGRPPRELLWPDRQRQWPRLRYHRHFMLAEHLHAEFAPAQPPPDPLDPVQRSNWERARAMYEARRLSMEAHLRDAYGCDRVTVTRVEHTLLAPGEFTATHKPIDAPDTYLNLSEELPALPPDLPLPRVPGVRP